ncbi:MAG: hypothetical protein OWR52_02375 [Acidibacillus sp.]|nr:hypothetical protein [Acidibacillus sp.]
MRRKPRGIRSVLAGHAQKVAQVSNGVVEGIMIWAICMSILLTPLVFDGWMKVAERMINHAIGGK